jgi:hypothetical protein
VSQVPAYAFTCDAPDCEATLLVGEQLATSARLLANKSGWRFVRWLFKGRRGGGTMFCLCPAHTSWRPDRKTGRDGGAW